MKDTKDFPLFSIITVCRNSEKTIEKTIQSVTGQTFQNFEYIIIDGASKDGTLDILKKYRKDITTVISEPDEGIYHAMNKGLSLARGMLVGIINSDDWYELNALQLVAQEYEASDRNTIFHGLCKYHIDGKEDKILSYHHDVLPFINISHPTTFIPSRIYLEYGYFNTDYRIAADYDLLLRFFKKGVRFKRIERVLANFSSGGVSESKNTKYEVLQIRYKHGLLSSGKKLLHILRYRFKDLNILRY